MARPIARDRNMIFAFDALCDTPRRNGSGLVSTRDETPTRQVGGSGRSRPTPASSSGSRASNCDRANNGTRLPLRSANPTITSSDNLK